MNPFLIGYKESYRHCSFQFHWSLSIAKPRMTPVFFVNTTESYEISLVTFNRQSSYDIGILRQNDRIIRVTMWVVHLPERIDSGRPNYHIVPDCAGRAKLQ